MSEASRAAALAHAATVHYGSADPGSTLITAEAFHAFITGAAEETAKSTKAVAAKAPVKPAKSAKPVAPPAEEDAPDETEVTKEQVGEAIEALLNANLRPKALGLFKKYGATSLSSLSADNYAAVKQEAEDILMSA